MMKKQSVLEKELERILKKEQAYIKKHSKEKTSVVNDKLDKVVPAKLKDTLHTAFSKAFGLIFEKGTSVIEKTTGREAAEHQYKVNAYAMDLKENKKTVRAFNKQAAAKRRMNVMVSSVEGAGLGVLGVGLPDIPLFTAMVLKSIYEIAMSFGYDYQSDKEKLFILRLIEVAMTDGELLQEKDAQINREIYHGAGALLRDEQIGATAAVMAEQMLYMKFIQGIPIAGLIGGLADCVYMNRITEYAMLKYNRKFLMERMTKVEKDENHKSD